MTGRLAGAVGIVTGAGRGLGVEVARALAAEGMALGLVARTGAQVRALAAELVAAGGTALAMPADVRDPAQVTALVEQVDAQLGPVGLLVNGAATIEDVEVPFWQADPAQVWDVVETNLRGPLLLTRAVLPGMVQRGGGRIVNITSRARAATRTGTYTGYAVSKRALSVLTGSLAQALEGTGVLVVDLLPGLVRTPMTAAMPVWRDVPDDGWDPASATASLVLEIAAGAHDGDAGALLDAPALARERYGTMPS